MTTSARETWTAILLILALAALATLFQPMDSEGVMAAAASAGCVAKGADARSS